MAQTEQSLGLSTGRLGMGRLFQSGLFVRVVALIAAVVIATGAGYYNYFDPADQEFYKEFQQQSESLVLGRMASGLPFSEAGLGWVEGDSFIPYIPQYGLQGRLFGLQTVGGVGLYHLACCFLFAVALTGMCVLLLRKYGKLYAGVFFAVSILSPWMIAMARNLYWVEFTMYMPAISTLILLESYHRGGRWQPWLIAAFASSLVRFLCGYEFCTVIMLFAVSFPLVDLICSARKQSDLGDSRKLLVVVICVGLALLLGFLVAVLIHASMRGDTVVEGLRSIWEQDVLRRTFGGDPTKYDPTYFDSLVANPFEVVLVYLFSWKTPVVAWLPQVGFVALALVSAGCLALWRVGLGRSAKEMSVLLCVFLLASLSWIVLARGHAYIHPHLDFIVWYFGCVQTCVYIVVRVVYELVRGNAQLIRRFSMASVRAALSLAICVLSIVWVGGWLANSQRSEMHSVAVVDAVKQYGEVLVSGDEQDVWVWNGGLLIEEKGSVDGVYVIEYHAGDRLRDDEGLEGGATSASVVPGSCALELPAGYSSEVIDRISFPEYDLSRIDVSYEVNGTCRWSRTYEPNTEALLLTGIRNLGEPIRL